MIDNIKLYTQASMANIQAIFAPFASRDAFDRTCVVWAACIQQYFKTHLMIIIVVLAKTLICIHLYNNHNNNHNQSAQ